MKTRTVLCILLAFAMLTALAACGAKADAKAEENKEAASAAEDLVLNNENMQLTVPAE